MSDGVEYMTTVDPDVQLAAAGDMEAFERIYRRHHARVFALCVRMTRSHYRYPLGFSPSLPENVVYGDSHMETHGG